MIYPSTIRFCFNSYLRGLMLLDNVQFTLGYFNTNGRYEQVILLKFEDVLDYYSPKVTLTEGSWEQLLRLYPLLKVNKIYVRDPVEGIVWWQDYYILKNL